MINKYRTDKQETEQQIRAIQAEKRETKYEIYTLVEDVLYDGYADLEERSKDAGRIEKMLINFKLEIMEEIGERVLRAIEKGM